MILFVMIKWLKYLPVNGVGEKVVCNYNGDGDGDREELELELHLFVTMDMMMNNFIIFINKSPPNISFYFNLIYNICVYIYNK